MIERDTKYYYQTLDTSWDNSREKQKENKVPVPQQLISFKKKIIVPYLANKEPN